MELNNDNRDNASSVSKQDLEDNGSPCIPPGLEALYTTCRSIYPHQANPLQVTALVKYWLGGPDPLDYISMFENPGDEEQDIPPHWHYISFGLSDLHGDGRVHEVTPAEEPSGFGFELTMRLQREPGEMNPPTWPAAIMQSLAKYVFQSDSSLCVGDHVSWHCPLDNSESRIHHMLMAKDAQLNTTVTPNGPVQFVQIVGITSEELMAAQHWNGSGICEIMKRLPESGGSWLVTNMRRGESIYDLDPCVSEEIETGIENDGSNLSGVSAKISWGPVDKSIMPDCGDIVEEPCAEGDLSSRLSQHQTEQIKSTLKKGLLESSAVASHSPGNLSENRNEETSDSAELYVSQKLPSLHITINLESAALFPLALRGRLKHGRHFTFKSVVGNSALTLVSPAVTGAFVDSSNPYALHGPWLQMFIPDTFLPIMSEDLSVLINPDEVTTPIHFKWPSRKLLISVVGESA